MPKGVPWSKEETDRLLALRSAGKKVSQIADQMGKSEQAVMKKLERLGLKVVDLRKSTSTTTSEWIIPEELFSVEEALKIQAAALKALEKPGLSKTEILRLKSVATVARGYQQDVAKYIDYCGLEKHLLELDEKFEKLSKQPW